MTFPKALAASILFAVQPAVAKSVQRAPPDPAKLLDMALQPAAVAYRGRMIVVHWYGKRSRAEEVNVLYSPVNRYRWEFLAPGAEESGDEGRHDVDRIVISDGTQEWIVLPHQNRVLKGDAIKSGPKRIEPEAERELLLKNYDPLIEHADTVIGRPVWVMQLVPKVAQKFHERLWIDQETGVILETRRFLPKHPYATLSRFSRFESIKNVPDDEFRPSIDSMTKTDSHGLDPDFMSLESLNRALDKDMSFPDELAGGFVFESADFLPIQGTTVRYLRYTDGLTVLSLFQTDRPVRMPKNGAKVVSSLPMPGKLEASSSGKILTWKSKQHSRYYTVIGDVSQELLQQISNQLQ